MLTVGAIFRPTLAPEELVPAARAAEDAGVAQLWLWEDCFAEGGVSAAAAALGATSRLQVAIGVLPVPLRNVALTAMELATLDRLFPGRLVAGLGHGVQSWMAQVGARAASPLTLLREYTEALRRLLDGDAVTTRGDYVSLDDVRLAWPPLETMRLHLAGEGPRTVDLVGEVGDGLVVPGGYDPARLRAVVGRVRDAAERAGRERSPVVTNFLPCAFGPDGPARIAARRAALGAPVDAPPSELYGDPAAVAEGLAAFAAAGVDTVALLPVDDRLDTQSFMAAAGEVAALVAPG